VKRSATLTETSALDTAEKGKKAKGDPAIADDLEPAFFEYESLRRPTLEEAFPTLSSAEVAQLLQNEWMRVMSGTPPGVAFKAAWDELYGAKAEKITASKKDTM
jgi:hypothetical protein